MNRNFKVPLTGKDESIQQASNPAPGRLRFKIPPSRPISSGAPTNITRRDNILLRDNLRKLFYSDPDDDDDDNTKDDDKNSSEPLEFKDISKQSNSCCTDKLQRKKIYSEGEFPSSSGATSSSSNIGRSVYSDQRFDSLMKDADLSQQQIKRKNESYRRLMESQEYLSDDLLDDTKNDNDTASTASDRSASTNNGSYNKASMHINLSHLSHTKSLLT